MILPCKKNNNINQTPCKANKCIRYPICIDKENIFCDILYKWITIKVKGGYSFERWVYIRKDLKNVKIISTDDRRAIQVGVVDMYKHMI